MNSKPLDKTPDPRDTIPIEAPTTPTELTAKTENAVNVVGDRIGMTATADQMHKGAIDQVAADGVARYPYKEGQTVPSRR